VPFIEKEIMELFEYRKETLVSNVIKAADKKKTMAAKKKYAKVDAETQTDCCQDDKNKKISSFFQPLRKDFAHGIEQSFQPIVKTAAMLSAKPLMIKLEDDL
jgi:glutamyl-tRNA reductase